MSAAHTPGPWEISSVSQDTGSIGIAKDRILIAEVHNGYSFMDVVRGDRPETQWANACLIEAAPVMFAALEAFVNGDNSDDMDTRYETARSALAKAKGWPA